MNSISKKNIGIFLGIFLSLEILSFLGYGFQIINQIMFFGLGAAALLLSVRKLEYGLMLVLAELVIGSKGYLFYFPLAEGKLIAVRLLLWTILMIVFAFNFSRQIIKDGKNSEYLKNIKSFIFIKQYLFLAAFVIIGLVSAFIYQNKLSDILLDFNAWLYFLILLPALASGFKKERLFEIFLAGAIWISIKTLLLLAIFSNNFGFASEFYSWLRKTLVGEMTNASGWKRVFIQSQIYSVIAYFFLLFKISAVSGFKKIWHRNNIGYLFLGGLFLSTLLISLSRSFWAGFLVAVLFSWFVIIRRFSFKQAAISALWTALGFIFAITLIFAATPLLAGNFQNQVLNRIGNQEEAALVSRWTLLPELIKEIRVNPISGQGFGASLTYISSDPRILASSPEGKYTTYAFEWGYLDMWLKIGIFGLLAYLLLLYKITRESLAAALSSDKILYFGMSAAFIFLAAVHMFTPYLNHPLGIGFIVLGSCLIQKDRVY